MKKISAVLLCIAVLSLFSGCAGSFSFGGEPDDPDTYVSLKKDGTVLQVIRESFSESNYELGELTGYIEQEIAEFNAENPAGDDKTPATLKKAEASNGVTDVELLFSDAESYAAFNEETFFVSNIGEYLLRPSAIDDTGRISVTELVNASDGSKITEDAINAFTDEQIVITDIGDRLYLPGKALYISENANAAENAASVRRKEDTAGLIYIIYK